MLLSLAHDRTWYTLSSAAILQNNLPVSCAMTGGDDTWGVIFGPFLVRGQKKIQAAAET